MIWISNCIHYSIKSIHINAPNRKYKRKWMIMQHCQWKIQRKHKAETAAAYQIFKARILKIQEFSLFYSIFRMFPGCTVEFS